jgi:predicted dehydrogenase/aryl-alcohol dehydrogenase-like predicted oxidoreductase
MKKTRWGFVGCGAIAKAFAHGISQTTTCEVVAVSGSSAEKAQRFAAEHGIPKAYGDNDALFADPNVDIVYICTPHVSHADLSIRAAAAGKHVLCEKPMTVNYPDAMTVMEAVRLNGVFFAEAYMYRCHPQTAKLVELLRDNVIGEIRMISASFCFGGGSEYNPASRLFRNSMAGGGIMDVGGYPVSMTRLIAGASQGKPFAEPVEVHGLARTGRETRVDEWASAQMKFASGIVAQLSAGIRVTADNQVRIMGSEGSIVIPSPWVCDRVNPSVGRIVINRRGKQPEEIAVPADRTTFAIEADTAVRSIAERQMPVMTWEDSLGNMRAMDAWRAAAGVVFEADTPAAYAKPLGGRPLRRSSGSFMKYGSVAGLEKPVSRLVMGVDNQETIAHATAMFDDFFTRGGNCFDTAWVYGAGKKEAIFGQWMKNRNIRGDISLIVKGAHTPFCLPKSLLSQFDESLQRLQTDRADIYFMHRDNPEVPVGEFMDALNQLADKGRLGVFGASNWTLARIKKANAWAKRHGKRGFSAVSNNFSLARMVSPVWAGCVASSDPEYMAWHRRSGMPLFAWSSQARGFFVPGLASPEKRDNDELVRCWYSDENFERQKRCFELARKKGVQPINVALAYVLNQPFDTFALIGPRTITETASSFEGLKTELTKREVAWLNLKS